MFFLDFRRVSFEKKKILLKKYYKYILYWIVVWNNKKGENMLFKTNTNPLINDLAVNLAMKLYYISIILILFVILSFLVITINILLILLF